MTLDASYEHCRDLHRTYGRSYYLATRLLPAWKRRHVHALYGFTRHTDDLVDTVGDDPTADGRAERLAAWSERFRVGMAGGPIEADPVLPAVLHTITVFDLPWSDFDAFLHSMAMDLTVREYADYPALLTYMAGSAAAIGTMMLPVLLAGGGPDEIATDRVAAAREPARQLGLGFQLTNFLRDVAEDRRRGRVYLPQDDLRRFGVHVSDLDAPSAGSAVRELAAFEIDRARGHYRAAEPGIMLLPPLSRRCVRVAAAVYGGILTEIERAHHDVLFRRAVVPRRRRLAALARELGRAA
ncbi:MAG TPA: phytoene/squalene synthase family protein [Actinocatenispora sp.]